MVNNNETPGLGGYLGEISSDSSVFSIHSRANLVSRMTVDTILDEGGLGRLGPEKSEQLRKLEKQLRNNAVGIVRYPDLTPIACGVSLDKRIKQHVNAPSVTSWNAQPAQVYRMGDVSTQEFVSHYPTLNVLLPVAVAYYNVEAVYRAYKSNPELTFQIWQIFGVGVSKRESKDSYVLVAHALGTMWRVLDQKGKEALEAYMFGFNLSRAVSNIGWSQRVAIASKPFRGGLPGTGKDA